MFWGEAFEGKWQSAHLKGQHSAEGTMADHRDVIEIYGGQCGYRKVHEAFARALAEPDAQGTHAHGARAAFLLTEIAPQLCEVSLAVSLREFERLGAPKSLLMQMKAFIDEREQPATGKLRALTS